MKKLLNVTLLAILVSVIYWACKKDSNNSSGNNLASAQQQLIANAKNYFENTVKIKAGNDKALADTIPIGGGEFNAVKSLIKNAVWSEAYVQTISIGKIVVVPIHFTNSLYIYTNYTDSTVRLPINKLSRLIVYADSLKQLHAEVVTEFPDDNFIKNSTSSFSGITLVQDWQGNYLHGYQYSASSIKKLVFNNAANAGDKTTNSTVAPDVAPAPSTETCYTSYVTTCVSTADNSQKYCTTTTQELGCISDPSDTDGGGSPSGGDYGGIAGGGSGGSNSEPLGFNSSGNDLSCQSFLFTKTTSNWQEAGVSGLQLVGDWFGLFGGFSIKTYGNVYVGVPLKTASGINISASAAAIAAADAANRAAAIQQAKYYGMSRELFDAIPNVTLAAEFRTLMQGFLIGDFNAGCTVSSSKSGANTITRPADWNSNDTCNN